MEGYYQRLDAAALPVRAFGCGTVPGRSGDLMVVKAAS
jgi:hypothetical protein